MDTTTNSPKEETREQKFKRLFPWVDPKYAMFPWADPEYYDAQPLPPDLQQVKDELKAEYITPYNLPWLHGYVVKELVEAAKDESTKAERIKKARDKASMAFLADQASGRIRLKDEDAEPMPEEVKIHLKELNQERRELKKQEREARLARIAQIEGSMEPKKVKSKIPMFSDPEAQAALKVKYPWVVAGSFSQDPEKSGGTLLNIQCETCKGERSIHLADAFHTKTCKTCKGKKNGSKPQVDQQPASGPDSK